MNDPGVLFGDLPEDLSNEDIVEMFKKGEPERAGLAPFGDNWEKEMEMHPLFMDEVPQEVLDGTLDREKWPVLASHLDILYEDDEEPEFCADNYKEGGNREFKLGNRHGYYKAVITYTEGIKKNKLHSNEKLKAQLYCNRAAAQFNLGNYRRATQDSEWALKFDPTYIKAVVRGVKSQQKLGHSKAVIEWCDKGLAIDRTHKELISIKVKSLQKSKEDERNARKAALKEQKERKSNMMLLAALKERNVNIYLPEVEDESLEEHEERVLDSLKCSSHGHVQLIEGVLVWPVRLLYPEYATSDVINQFDEENTLLDHLSYMFPPEGQSPEWDQFREYTSHNVVLYVNTGTEMMQVKLTQKLKDILSHPKILIAAGVPTFEVFVKGSETHNKHVEGS